MEILQAAALMNETVSPLLKRHVYTEEKTVHGVDYFSQSHRIGVQGRGENPAGTCPACVKHAERGGLYIAVFLCLSYSSTLSRETRSARHVEDGS